MQTIVEKKEFKQVILMEFVNIRNKIKGKLES